MEFYTSFGKHFDKIRVRGYADGKRFNREFKYSPYLFIPSSDAKAQYRTVKDVPVEKVTYNSFKEARETIERDRSNVFGSTLYDYVYINDTYKEEITFNPSWIRVGNFDIETDSHTGYGSPESAEKEIISISLKVFGAKEIYVLGLKDYTPQINHPVKVNYHKCDDEKELLTLFISLWRKLDFDVITGWNIEQYDIPYTIRRIGKVLGEEWAKKLSPWGSISTRNAVVFNQEKTFFSFDGISTIDYLETYKKFTFGNEETYKLDYIAKKVTGRGKLDYSEYGSLDELYIKNPNKFYDYNIIDVLSVEDIDKKEKFMGQIFTIAFYAKVNFNDTFTTVRIWDVMIHNYLLEQGIVVPQTLGNKKTEQNVGGYVKDPHPIRYGYTVSFDFASLYPNMIRMYNISPETLITQVESLRYKYDTVDKILAGFVTAEFTKKLVDNNLCISGKGTIFSRKKQGFLPALMSKLFTLRKVYKKQMLTAEADIGKAAKGTPEYVDASNRYTEFNNKQMAIKILLNSGYGALANEYFRWYSNDLAESITMSGQLSTRWAERALNVYINKIVGTEGIDYVIACDTDSAYVDLDMVVKRARESGVDLDTQAKAIAFLDEFCKGPMNDMINAEFEKLHATMNAFEKTLDMKREVIASDAIWTGKKHYCMKIWNKEGVAYPNGKLKLTGLEAVKSSTPSVVRDMMKELIPIILDNHEDKVLEYFDKGFERFQKLPFDEMAKPTKVSEFNKYADPVTIVKAASKAPAFSKAALSFNYLIDKLNLQTKYRKINEGDNIRWVPLKRPNPYGLEVIASTDLLPPEFELDEYVDYYAQYEKIFLKPMRDLAVSGGMQLSTDTVDLNDLME